VAEQRESRLFRQPFLEAGVARQGVSSNKTANRTRADDPYPRTRAASDVNPASYPASSPRPPQTFRLAGPGLTRRNLCAEKLGPSHHLMFPPPAGTDALRDLIARATPALERALATAPEGPAQAGAREPLHEAYSAAMLALAAAAAPTNLPPQAYTVSPPIGGVTRAVGRAAEPAGALVDCGASADTREHDPAAHTPPCSAMAACAPVALAGVPERSPTYSRRLIMNMLVGASSVAVATPVAADSGLSAQRAALARMEEIVKVLRESHVCEDWQIDEAAAERALAYCRAGAGRGEDETGEEVALNFLIDRGQSLDWVFRGNASGMICHVAASSPRSVIARPTDPVFAAIERHRAAVAEMNTAREIFGDCERKHFETVHAKAWVPIPCVPTEADMPSPENLDLLEKSDSEAGAKMSPQLQNLKFRRCYSPAEIREAMPTWLTDRQRKRMYKKALNSRGSERRRIAKAKRKIGWATIERRWEDSIDQEMVAQVELVCTIPTTAAGARLVISYFLEHVRGTMGRADILDCDDGKDALRLLTSLHSTFGAIKSPASAAGNIAAPDCIANERWVDWRSIAAERRSLNQKIEAAEAAMPTWAQSGPEMIDHLGNPCGGTHVGWPAHVGIALPSSGLWRRVRKSPASQRKVFDELMLTSPEDHKENLVWYREELRSIVRRRREQRMERERVGLPALEAREQGLYDAQHEIRHQLKRPPVGTNALAALLLINLTYGVRFDETQNMPHDEFLQLVTEMLSVLLPQLTGAIATDVTDFLHHPDRPMREFAFFNV
jgi:hypothetical protein